MPPEPHITGWTQVTLHYSSPAGKHANVLSYSTALQPGPSDVFSIAQAWWVAVGPYWTAAMSNMYNADYVEVKTRWPNVVNYAGNYYIPQPHPGARAGVADASSVALALAWKSGARGRSFQGRTFAGGFSEADTNFNTVGTALMTLLLSYGNSIGAFANVPGMLMRFSIASVKRNIMVTVSQLLFDAIIDSQRRRLTGRGQ